MVHSHSSKLYGHIQSLDRTVDPPSPLSPPHSHSASSPILADGGSTLVDVDVTVGTRVPRGTGTAVVIRTLVCTSATILTGGHVSTDVVVNLAETARVAGVADALPWQVAGGTVCV